MFFPTVISALALVSVASAASSTTAAVSDFVVHTPAITASCKPLNLTWEATKGPYNVIVVSSHDPCGPIIADLGDHKTNHFVWNATVPAGSYSISVEDAKGQEGWSKAFAVKQNTLSTTCKYSTAYQNSSTAVLPTDVAGAAGASPSDVGEPVGAAGSGILSGGALSMRHVSAPAMVAGALVAAIAFSL